MVLKIKVYETPDSYSVNIIEMPDMYTVKVQEAKDTVYFRIYSPQS